MSSYFDILKTAKVGGNLPSYYETLFARKLPCSKFAWQETTLSGVPPLSFSAKGSALTAYSVTGNMTQTGTPTPDAPITPEECGDFVTEGEYGIPITVGGTTYPLYLSEPLRKIGEYSDTVDSSGAVTRRIRKLVLDGTETWINTSAPSLFITNLPTHVFKPTPSGTPAITAVCSHFKFNSRQVGIDPNAVHGDFGEQYISARDEYNLWL